MKQYPYYCVSCNNENSFMPEGITGIELYSVRINHSLISRVASMWQDDGRCYIKTVKYFAEEIEGTRLQTNLMQNSLNKIFLEYKRQIK